MAFDAFLKLEGVEGEATRHGYEKQIDLESFSFGGHNPTNPYGSGMAAGRVDLSPFTASKRTDKASAKLFQACCNGKHFPKATVTLLKAGGQSPVDFLKYEFTELLVQDIQWSGGKGGDDTPTESLSFGYATVLVTYSEQKADGSKGTAIVAGWDLRSGKPLSG
jgi:type VI secretion system secreted protein Hcp